ncbi:MAG: hypothetical protein JSW39_13450, partial [Desulfobacterales bacterium]
VFTVSVDGVGPNYAGCHLLPEVLSKLNLYAEAGDQNTPDSSRQRVKSSRKSLMKSLRDLIPYNIRREVSRLLPRHLQHQLSMKWVSTNIDWERTKAFCIPNANEGYIRINLQGREPKGTIPAGFYGDFCKELQDRCRELSNPINKLLAVRQVVCSHQIFEGDRLASLPDIVINWDFDAQVLNQLYSETCGIVEGVAGYQTEPYYTGNHRPAAFFIARGPTIGETGIAKGGHIVDIVPTLLALMEVKIPDGLDGRVWENLL